MAPKSKAQTLLGAQRRIQHALKWREEEGYDLLWGRMTDMYRGKHFAATTAEDRIAVNVAFGTINVIYPSVSVNYPKVTVNPTKPEWVLPAETCEGMVNYYWKHHDFHAPFRRATKDLLIFGHGWLKVGWHYKEQEQPLTAEEQQAEYNTQRSEADEFAAANPALAGDVPTDEEIAAGLGSTKPVVVEDRPFVERVSVFDVYVDPEATCMDDADWIAQRLVRPLSEARTDPRYSPAARSRLEATQTLARDEERRRGKRNRQSEAKDDERVTLWEFYDLRRGTMSVFADDAESFLVDPRPMPYAFGQPFTMLGNYEVPDFFYPLGDLEAIEPLQQELNKVRSQMMNVRKHFARKYLYRESAFGPEGRVALQSDVDMTMVPVVDEQSDFGQLIAPMPQIQVPTDLYNHSQTVENDISQVTGVSEYQRGQVPETRRTATEAAIISDSVNARAADKLAIIEKSIAQVGRRVVQICQQFVTGDHVIRVLGQDDAMNWVEFDRDAIQGEFDYEVEGGSTQPMNETARRQQAVAMLNALAPLIGVVLDPAKIAAHVLQHGFGVKNPQDFLMAPPPMVPPGADPNAQQPPQQPQPQGMGAPGGEPGMQEPPMGDNQSGGPGGSAPGGIPPEILAQLAGQVGLA